jgi:hypothetical protein
VNLLFLCQANADSEWKFAQWQWYFVSILDSLEPATEKRKRNVQLYEEEQCTRRLKRKHFEGEEQRRKFEKEDEMLFKSKRDTKCRMSWLTTKRTDYNEEDKDLEQQVKMLIQTKQL